jgi:hypothetical protein
LKVKEWHMHRNKYDGYYTKQWVKIPKTT